MLCHLNLFVRSFLCNSGIDDFHLHLTTGPEPSPDYSWLDRMTDGRLTINHYTHSEHGFNPPYLGGMPRWDSVSTDTVCMMVDVDTIVCGDLSGVVDRCRSTKKVLGVLNIGSPFRFYGQSSRSMWSALENEFGIDFEYIEHQGVGVHERFGNVQKHYTVANNYVNYGFVLIPGEYIKIIAESLPEIIKSCGRLFPGNFWNGEISFCVALNLLGIPVEIIDLKYNYPDRNEFFEKRPCDDIRLLHLVRKRISDRSEILRLLSGSKHIDLVDSFLSDQLQNIYGGVIN